MQEWSWGGDPDGRGVLRVHDGADQWGGKNVEGAIAPTGPLIVPEELPANHATRSVSLDFTKRYEAAFGEGSRNAFGGYSHDAVMLIGAAIPGAMKKANTQTGQWAIR